MESATEHRGWSVDEILADPLGYRRYVDARIEEDAAEWVDQRMRELAEARQHRHGGAGNRSG